MKCLTVGGRIALACGLLLVSGAGWAQWRLEPAESSVQFVSVKNGSVGEVHEFKALSGQISSAGEARVEIDLDSVESMIPIRNERMREMLFETAEFPTATVSLRLEPGALEELDDGERHRMNPAVTLSLHGFERELEIPAEAVMLGRRLYVYSPRPVIISAADFGLAGGIEKLREVAGLNNISTAVPVTFSLKFARSF